MVGRILWTREKGRLLAERCPAGPVELECVTLPLPPGLSPRKLDRRIRRGERLLSKRGARRVILPEEFPWITSLRLLRPVDPLPFYQAHGDLLALGALERLGISRRAAVVALSAPRPSPLLLLTAERLCPLVRGLHIHLPGGGEGLAQQLHRRCGIPVYPSDGVHVTVCFGPDGGRWGWSLPLYQPEFSRLPLRLHTDSWTLPPDCADGVLALLWEQGRLERGSLRVMDRQLDTK